MRDSDADHTLVRIEVSQQPEPPSEALRAAADPDEPAAFGSSVESLVPAVDARSVRSPLRLWILPVVVLAAAAAVASRSSHTLDFDSRLRRHPCGSGSGVFVLAGLLLVPLELLAVAAGVVFGALRGGLVALVGSLVAAVIGYVAGRVIGADGLQRWMSQRSYRSVRQLERARSRWRHRPALRDRGERRVDSSCVRCGAGSFATYMAGTAIALAPAVYALSGLGGLLRHTLLNPSVSNGLLTIGAAVLLFALASGLRAILLHSSVCAGCLRPSRQRGVRLVAAPAPLRIATYNVHACVGRDGRHDPDRVATVIGELDADVVALQELTYPASVALETRDARLLCGARSL